MRYRRSVEIFMFHLGPSSARWIIAARRRERPHTVPYVFRRPKRSSNRHSFWKADEGSGASLCRAWPKRQRVRAGLALWRSPRPGGPPRALGIREASWTAVALYRFLAHEVCDVIRDGVSDFGGYGLAAVLFRVIDVRSVTWRAIGRARVPRDGSALTRSTTFVDVAELREELLHHRLDLRQDGLPLAPRLDALHERMRIPDTDGVVARAGDELLAIGPQGQRIDARNDSRSCHSTPKREATSWLSVHERTSPHLCS